MPSFFMRNTLRAYLNAKKQGKIKERCIVEYD